MLLLEAQAGSFGETGLCYAASQVQSAIRVLRCRGVGISCHTLQPLGSHCCSRRIPSLGNTIEGFMPCIGCHRKCPFAEREDAQSVRCLCRRTQFEVRTSSPPCSLGRTQLPLEPKRFVAFCHKLLEPWLFYVALASGFVRVQPNTHRRKLEHKRMEPK